MPPKQNKIKMIYLAVSANVWQFFLYLHISTYLMPIATLGVTVQVEMVDFCGEGALGTMYSGLLMALERLYVVLGIELTSASCKKNAYAVLYLLYCLSGS